MRRHLAAGVVGRPLTLIEAPTNLGLSPPRPGREPGVSGMPDRLRALGLAERLGRHTLKRVVPPAYRPEREADTGVRNASAIATYSRALADAVGRALDGGSFPLVLGGDCSVLLGNALALARRGRFGLAFLDGHQDLLTPTSAATSGGAAGMDLALVTGHGPSLLTGLGGIPPLFDASDVALLGFRDADAVYDDPAIRPARDAMCRVGLAQIRAIGPEQAAARAPAHVRRRGVDGLWIHLDADVLDDAVMPAVDDRQPDGLRYDELAAVLGPMLASGRVAGMEVTIYDPTRDPGGRAGAGLVDALVRVLRPAASA